MQSAETGRFERIGLANQIRYDEKTGCWNFTGGLMGGGYGSARGLDGRKIPVHRLAAILWMGLNPTDSREVCHKCDNPACFNPKHLFIATHSENMWDSVRKGRHMNVRKTHCSNGHAFDEKNTKIQHRIRRGAAYTERKCRACHQIYKRNHRHRLHLIQ